MNGPVVRVMELLSDGRLRMGNETGISDLIVARSALLVNETLKPGLDLRLDANHHVAVDIDWGDPCLESQDLELANERRIRMLNPFQSSLPSVTVGG